MSMWICVDSRGNVETQFCKFQCFQGSYRQFNLRICQRLSRMWIETCGENECGQKEYWNLFVAWIAVSMSPIVFAI